MCKLPWQWNMKWNLTFYFEIDDKVLEVRILDNSFFIDNILYSFTQVAALILPLQVPDDQSCNEDSSKILGEGRWYWIHDFVATFGVNDRPISMAFCS